MENIYENDIALRTQNDGSRFASRKMAGQDFQQAKALWVFTKNSPTAFKTRWLIALMISNDLERTCDAFPIVTTYCNKKTADGKIGCPKCVLKGSIVDCHELKTDMFLISCSGKLVVVQL